MNGLNVGEVVTVVRNDGGNKKGRMFEYTAEVLGYKKDRHGRLMVKIKTEGMGYQVEKYVSADRVTRILG